MIEIKIEFPVKLNGVIITEDVFSALDDFQTNNTLGHGKPDYNNGGIADVNKYIDEFNNYLIGIIARASLDESTEKEKELLSSLYWIRGQINLFKVPDEFLTKE